MLQAIQGADKLQVNQQIHELKDQFVSRFYTEDTTGKAVASSTFSNLEKQVARNLILSDRKRNDGRALDEVRPIQCDLDLLPCAHGSSVFTRGQTQALVTLTLGSTDDEQKIDNLEGESYKTFMLHYNFPPFSVGEVGFLRGPGRREVGHGSLAERAITAVIPNDDIFPYTIRIVSDILESNGSIVHGNGLRCISVSDGWRCPH